MKFRKILRLLAGSSTAILLASVAFAQDAESYKALQSSLKDLGFYEGEIDGHTGPATRGAMKSYASANGLEKDFWAIVTRMSLDSKNDVDWTDTMDEGLNRNLEEYLNDAQSARFGEKHFFRTPYGASACVKVNAKNKYGAYVGYTQLYFAVVESSGFLPKVSPSNIFIGPFPVSDDALLVWCSLGYVSRT